MICASFGAKNCFGYVHQLTKEPLDAKGTHVEILAMNRSL